MKQETNQSPVLFAPIEDEIKTNRDSLEAPNKGTVVWDESSDSEESDAEFITALKIKQNQHPEFNLALDSNDADKALELLNAGFNANGYLERILTLACEDKNQAWTDILKQQMQNYFNTKGDIEGTPYLIFAIQKQAPLQVLTALISMKSDIYAKDNNGKTVLQHLSVQDLLNTEHTVTREFHDVERQHEVEDRLFKASREGDTQTLQTLLTTYKYRQSRIDTQTFKSLYNSNKYLQKMVDISLFFSIQANQIESAKVLIAHKANVNYRIESIKEWDDLLAPPLLQYATVSSRPQILDLLLCANADVNAIGTLGYTPLHQASNTNNILCLEVLIKHKANINHSECGNSPLMLAARNGHQDAILTLLNHKAQIQSPQNPSDHTKSALYSAAKAGDAEIVKMLLSYGAHVTQEIKNSAKGKARTLLIHFHLNPILYFCKQSDLPNKYQLITDAIKYPIGMVHAEQLAPHLLEIVMNLEEDSAKRLLDKVNLAFEESWWSSTKLKQAIKIANSYQEQRSLQNLLQNNKLATTHHPSAPEIPQLIGLPPRLECILRGTNNPDESKDAKQRS